MSDADRFQIQLSQEEDYRFRVAFDWPGLPVLNLDAAPPLGEGSGPDAERVLAAAVGHCLSASLLFCLRKFKTHPGPIRAEVAGTLARNERGRLRVGGLEATLHLSESAAEIAHLDRCAQQFEDFCVVSDAVRHGIPITVRVLDAEGKLIYGE
jgi:organic hydroperoxide reductase OsmC/OhrA